MNRLYFKKDKKYFYMKIYMKILVSALIMISLFSVSSYYAAAVEKNLSVKIYTPLDFTDIWLGTSTGGYDLMAEKGTTYTFKVYIKNGMTNRSLHNVYIVPNNFPFEVNSITPKSIEQLKPMEIRIYVVNISIPENASTGKYGMDFEVASDEFPPGIFNLEHELEVVRKMNTGLYVAYAVITMIILVWFFIRKGKIWKEDKGKKRKPE